MRTSLRYWTFSSPGGGTAAIDTRDPLNSFNPHYLSVNADGAFTLENEGYWGMNIVSGEDYQLKLAARAEDDFNAPADGQNFWFRRRRNWRAGQISGLTGRWEYYSLELPAQAGDPKARLQIASSGPGSLCLDMVSLMPKQTWKNHGLRPDLAQALDDLHPAFMRFPGGNWVEGDDIAHMYHWKYTIGDIDSRTPLWNTWGYNTTQGLGYL